MMRMMVAMLVKLGTGDAPPAGVRDRLKNRAM
jgi:hypothetical protein